MGTGRPGGGSEASGPSPSGRPVAVLHDRGTPIDLGALLREAWALFTAAWPTCLLVYWGAGAASWLILFLLTWTLADINVLIGDREFTPILEFVRFVGLFVVPAWTWLGQSLAYLKLARGRPSAPEDLFRGGPYLLTAILDWGIVLALSAVLPLIAYGSAEAWLAGAGHGSLASMLQQLLAGRIPEMSARYEAALLVLLGLMALGYVAFLGVMVRLGQFPYLIIDQSAGVLESLRGSWELTRGRSATIFLVYLAQLTLNFAGLLACYFGLFVTLPLSGLISAVTYNALAGPPPPDEKVGSETWEEDPAG